MDYDFESELQIDRLNLDDELIRQAGLFMKYSELAVNARFQRDKLKEALDLKKAELDGKVRENPGRYGLSVSGDKKPTEAAIASAVLQHPEVVELNSDLINSVRDSGVLDSAREAFNHKKSALEYLVKLWLGGYFADVKTPRNVIAEHSAQKTDDSQRRHLEENTRLQEMKQKRRKLLED